MMFSADGLRSTVLRAALVLTAAVLGACGGGEQVDRFQPTRLIAFGDETSVIENVAGDADDPNGVNGRKYSVNFKNDAATPRDCLAFPIWIQTLAISYGLVFPECNPAGVATPSGVIRAQPNANSGDVKTQIDNFLLASSFNAKDLVTVLAGQHDVLEQYALVKAGTSTEAQATGVLEQAGTGLAAQVNRIAALGGKVLISLVPDMGFTPFAIAEGSANAELLSRLTVRFNSRLRVNLTNDGRMIGLLLTDELVQGLVKNSTLATKDAACTVDVPLCTTLTLATTTTTTMTVLPTSTTVSSWLWSDSTHLGVAGHNGLGSLAVSRATGNPF
jgi:outer membrane lipase/esterase